MHSSSLPRGDRDVDDAKPETSPRAARHANVLAVPGGFFRAMRRGGRLVTAKTVRGAKLYMPTARDAMDKERRRLERHGIQTEIVDVNIRIGDTA